MTDLTKTIIPKSDQLNSDDLIGRSLTIKITQVSLASGDQPVKIHYENDNGKPWLPCKSMRRVLIQVWGSDGAAFVGRSLTLFRDDKVMFGGVAVGGIRISHMSHIKEAVTMALTVTRANRKPFTVQPLVEVHQRSLSVAVMASLEEAASNMASKGIDALNAWWSTLAKEEKAYMKPALDKFKALAAEADKQAAPPAETTTDAKIEI